MTTKAMQSEMPIPPIPSIPSIPSKTRKAGPQSSRRSWQFVRYVAVGGWNTIFGYCTYAALTWVLSRHLAYGYMYAAVLSLLINITVAFFGYKWFVFKTKGNYFHEWMRCFLVYGAAALPNILLLTPVIKALVYVFHIAPGERLGSTLPFQFTIGYLQTTFFTAPYIAGAILTASTVLFSFFGHKHFSFRQRANDTDGHQ